jgi:hypothetical protein
VANQDHRRPAPYVWPTWLSKILGGENKCRWAAWYKTQHKYAKLPPTKDREEFLTEWTAKHDAMVEARVKILRAEDAPPVLRVEDEGAFHLRGKSVTLGGKPDIVALYPDKAVVYDQKSGKRRGSDHWQVLIYMLALPLTWLPKGMQLLGFVEYRDGLAPVRPLGRPERGEITSLLAEVGDPNSSSPRVPSTRECSFCDILNCPERATAEPDGSTEEF